MQWTDGRCRCRWANPNNPACVQYHDTEWGVPVREDRTLFEFLILESFQAGLSWECVLQKREEFRKAFDGFDPEAIRRYGAGKIERLLQNPGIIRHRGKIRAAVKNAGVFLQIQQEFGSFSEYLWGWTNGKTIIETGQTTSALSDRLSQDLKKRGMSYVGSTVCYSYLQAVGILNSHEPECFLCQLDAGTK